MDLGALAWVERDNNIRIEKVGAVVKPMQAYGITYRIVTIGSQTWTAENMRHTVSHGATQNYNDTRENLPYNDDGYGLLYDWKAAMNDSINEGAQGICATGWHIPSDDDWM